MFLGNPGEGIALCKVPGMLRGREGAAAAAWERMEPKNAEECASHYLHTH